MTGVLFMLALAACSKGSGSNSTSATYYTSNGICYNNQNVAVSSSYCTTGYYTTNGICYNSSGAAVSSSYCSSTGYTYSNGVCYNSSGISVATTYCTGTTTTGTTSTYQVCNGYYYWNGQLAMCWGTNCRGYTLVSATTGQTVVCQ